MADTRIGRTLLKLTIPAFFGMVVMTLYNVVDTIFIGRYVGPLGIAGLSIVFPIQMLAMGMGQMSGMGGASLISRLLGASQKQRAQHVLGNAISSTVLLSAIILIAGDIRPDFWLRLIGASEEVLPYAREYMVIILGGMIFMTLSAALNGLIRSEGNARVAMNGMIIGAALNIVLDAVFIIPLDMGVMGAAWATVIAQFLSTVYFLRYYRSSRSHLKITRRDLTPDFGILKSIYAIGSASLAMTLAGSLSAVLVNRVLGTYGGDYAISAFGVINRLMMFAIMPGIVIGQGLQPILGYNYGAKRYSLALRSIKLALVWSTSFCLAAFLLLFFFPEVFIRIFTSDSGLIDMSAHAMKRIFFFLYLIGFGLLGSLVFQSLGKAVKAFVTSLARPALFLIPLVIILPRFLGLDGVWWAFAITDLLTVILVGCMLIPQIREIQKKKSAEYPAPVFAENISAESMEE
ncbi:MAG: MATE family efflux transporter [Dehalococcoidales bacterium]|nr:MATE family efflux transporter [Dehalococcoidales bacterium]